MLAVAVIACIIIAALAVGTAVLANRMWPDRTAWRLTVWTVNVLVIVTFGLTVLLTVSALSAPCPTNGACDAGAMAALGWVTVGSIAAVAAILVGTPVAYFTATRIKEQ